MILTRLKFLGSPPGRGAKKQVSLLFLKKKGAKI
jgi:hypothetical protein